ncbi:hypothetical protein EYM_05045 [Ignicoccus islandicus DSM 13165]|uniref:Major facilitator superfamily (MFS) profile domain-containing protein n=1 Tax=Ignicoccus islandicus DSM 13165 TaxID=940295 RepID=A0A0U3EDN7_9CREN|nr:MFS transporter [Ignicoccus islandicus]ALU12547.1 hypothetical protein EYM_05045 [Ignicoccus islandicus DSM 13165]
MWTRLVALSFIISATFAATNVAIPYLLLYFKGSLPSLLEELLPAQKVAVEVGVLTSAFMITRVGVAFASGYIAERIGYKRSILIGLILYFLTGLELLISKDFMEVLIARALQGFASALVWPVAESIIVLSVPSEKTKALMLYVMAMNIGFVIGPALGGSILQLSAHVPLELGIRIPFLLLPIGALLGLATVYSIPELRNKSNMKIKELKSKVLNAVYVFFFNGFINGVAAGMLMSVSIVYIMQYVTSIPAMLSALLAGSGLVSIIVTMPFMKKINALDIEKKFELLIISGTLHKVSFMLLPFSKSFPIAFIVLSIINVFSNVLLPLLRSLLSDVIPKEITAKVFGMQQAFFNLGMIIGPSLGAFIYRFLEAQGLDGGYTFVLAGLVGLSGIAALSRVNVEEVKSDVRQ